MVWLSQKEALAGIDSVRTKLDKEKEDSDRAAFAVGKSYQDNDLQTKAEDVYKNVAINPAVGRDIRQEANAQLLTTLAAQWWDRDLAKAKDMVEGFVWCLALLIALVLTIAAISSVMGHRKAILIHDFKAPSDEIARGLALNLKYARASMRDPSLSPLGVMPAPLMANLFTFDDEVKPIEDLEIAGGKIPFSSIARLLGGPKIQVNGGFDGISPLGSAFAIIQKRGSKFESLHQKQIRVGVPREQRLDLLNFAYDVMVRASSAYVDD